MLPFIAYFNVFFSENLLSRDDITSFTPKYATIVRQFNSKKILHQSQKWGCTIFSLNILYNKKL